MIKIGLPLNANSWCQAPLRYDTRLPIRFLLLGSSSLNPLDQTTESLTGLTLSGAYCDGNILLGEKKWDLHQETRIRELIWICGIGTDGSCRVPRLGRHYSRCCLSTYEVMVSDSPPTQST